MVRICIEVNSFRGEDCLLLRHIIILKTVVTTPSFMITMPIIAFNGGFDISEDGALI